MTVTLEKSGPEPDAVPTRSSRTKPPGLGRRLRALATSTATRSCVTLLAFMVALVVGAILIALSDSATRKSLGYFTQHPSDTFRNGWKAISAAYSALFRGLDLQHRLAVLQRRQWPIFGPISDTLVNAAPLILGGLAVASRSAPACSTSACRAADRRRDRRRLRRLPLRRCPPGCTWSSPSSPACSAAPSGAASSAVLKAKTGAHEVITTIMLNYVARGPARLPARR